MTNHGNVALEKKILKASALNIPSPRCNVHRRKDRQTLSNVSSENFS